MAIWSNPEQLFGESIFADALDCLYLSLVIKSRTFDFQMLIFGLV